jgi:hypothetical protein
VVATCLDNKSWYHAEAWPGGSPKHVPKDHILETKGGDSTMAAKKKTAAKKPAAKKPAAKKTGKKK